jgi:3-deoxy-manno-octulosonate cytidylyltransferase (CMP-KDO synthetase)
MNPVIIIPARLKATRLPDKPLADICGKPMIVHVMERAQESRIGRVFVACDDETIKTAVVKAGGVAIMTDLNHASGSDRIYEALQKIDPKAEHDIVVNVQGDVPTIEPGVIRSVLAPLYDKHTDIATLACKIKDEKERTDPSVVKAVLTFHSMAGGEHSSPSDKKSLGTALYFTRATAPYGDGELYHHIGIYAYRRSALEKFVKLPTSPLEQRERLEQLRALEAGMKIGVAIVDTIPLGVDTQEHLARAKEMLKA